jgi:hypothetical protein
VLTLGVSDDLEMDARAPDNLSASINLDYGLRWLGHRAVPGSFFPIVDSHSGGLADAGQAASRRTCVDRWGIPMYPDSPFGRQISAPHTGMAILICPVSGRWGSGFSRWGIRTGTRYRPSITDSLQMGR